MDQVSVNLAVGLADVKAARERLGADVHTTPLLSSRQLSEAAGGPVWLKTECLQRVGAFKIRGALNAVRTLTSEERARGLTTFSSGNHAQAVALAARVEGCRAVVFMPEDAPPMKAAAAKEYGAEVRFAGVTSNDRRSACMEAIEKEGLVLIPPFDDPRIIAGQGTCGLELFSQAPDPVDDVLVPVGGGGLISGVALVAEARGARVHGVEPVTGNVLEAALRAGEPVDIPPPETIADGLKPLRLGELNFAVLKDRVHQSILVTDDEIRGAMRFLQTRAKLVVEPSGAVGVAALLSGRLRLEGRTAVVVLSGGNTDPASPP